MVFFTCNSCGESLKKNQVEKHYQFKCRNCESLSCVDCQKDFWGDTYKEHIKCISEEEKYSGKDYKPKPGANKGEVKQNAWIEQVKQAIQNANANPALKTVLQNIEDYPNIPRKKAKFENFLKNSMRVRNPGLITQAWDMLSAAATAQKKEEEKTEKPNGTKQESSSTPEEANESCELKLNKREKKEERRKKKDKTEKKDKKSEEQEEVVKKSKKKSKKRKHEESEEEDLQETANGESHQDKEPASKKKKSKKDKDVPVEENLNLEILPDDNEKTGKFNWEGVIVGVLKKAADKEISVKKLRKKVLAEYYAQGGDEKIKSEEKLLSKFNQKINKNPRLKVLKEKVKLVR